MKDTPSSDATDLRKGAPPRHAAWTLLATILASSMAFIDGTALNVALDALQRDLGASGAQLLWIVNAYMLSLAAFLLLGGSLGDHFGRNRIFGSGITLFALASLVCGLSPNVGVLIAARAVQGVGGALMVPGSLAILSANFPPERRGGAIGTWSAFSTLTTLVGPALGGVLASAGLWRFVFFINLPLAALALFCLRRVPETRDAQAPRALDYPGTVFIALGLTGLTFGAIELAQGGAQVSQSVALASLAGGVVALAAFVAVEARSTHPMVQLSLFRSRTFTGTNLMTFFLYGALSGATFLLPLDLIQVQGYDASIAGLTMLPFAVLLIILSPIMGRLVDRIGPHLPLTIGPAVVAAGFLLLALPSITSGPSDYWRTFLPGALCLGIGMGITVAPLTTAVMGAVPSHEAGIASGVNNEVTRSAQVLALAALGGVALATFGTALQANVASMLLSPDARQSLLAGSSKLGRTPIPPGLDAATQAAVHHAIQLAFVDAFRTVLLIAAGLAIASAILSWLLIGSPRLVRGQKPAGVSSSAGGTS